MQGFKDYKVWVVKVQGLGLLRVGVDGSGKV